MQRKQPTEAPPRQIPALQPLDVCRRQQLKDLLQRFCARTESAHQGNSAHEFSSSCPGLSSTTEQICTAQVWFLVLPNSLCCLQAVGLSLHTHTSFIMFSGKRSHFNYLVQHLGWVNPCLETQPWFSEGAVRSVSSIPSAAVDFHTTNTILYPLQLCTSNSEQ